MNNSIEAFFLPVDNLYLNHTLIFTCIYIKNITDQSKGDQLVWEYVPPFPLQLGWMSDF